MPRIPFACLTPHSMHARLILCVSWLILCLTWLIRCLTWPQEKWAWGLHLAGKVRRDLLARLHPVAPHVCTMTHSRRDMTGETLTCGGKDETRYVGRLPPVMPRPSDNKPCQLAQVMSRMIKSTSNQPSKPCTVLQYPSRKTSDKKPCQLA